MIWTGNYIELELSEDEAYSIPSQGPADDSVDDLYNDINDRLEKINFEDIVKELLEYGAWEESELREDPELTYKRLLWIASLDLQEYGE